MSGFMLAGSVACGRVWFTPLDAQPPGRSDGGAGGVDGTDAVPPETAPASCQAILAADPAAPSAIYWVNPIGEPFQTYCDMETSGGGWTKVTSSLPVAVVDALKGPLGRQMLKCSDPGPEHVISPQFSNPWTWTGSAKVLVGGIWIANGSGVACGTLVEATVACTTYFGVGCDEGIGARPKVYPGIREGVCGDTTSAFSNGALSVCGSQGYSEYSVFVRDG